MYKARIAFASSGFVDLLNRYIIASTHDIAQIEEIVGKDELLALKPEEGTRNIVTSKAIFRISAFAVVVPPMNLKLLIMVRQVGNVDVMHTGIWEFWTYLRIVMDDKVVGSE